MTLPTATVITSVPAHPAVVLLVKRNAAHRPISAALRATRVHLCSFRHLTRSFTITSR